MFLLIIIKYIDLFYLNHDIINKKYKIINKENMKDFIIL